MEKRFENKGDFNFNLTFMDSPMGIITHSSLENRLANPAKKVMIWRLMENYFSALLITMGFLRNFFHARMSWEIAEELFNSFMDLVMVQ